MAGPYPPPGAHPGPPPPPPPPPGPPGSAPYGYAPYGPPPAGYGPPPGWTYIAPTHATRLGLVPAAFAERLAAFLLDGFILMAATIPLWIAGFAFVASGWDTEPGTCTTSRGVDYRCTVPSDAAVLRIIAAVGIGLVVLVLAYVFYYGRLEGERGQTIGKRVLGIRVVDQQTGHPIGFGRGVGRLAVRAFLSGQVACLGYLWMLWDDNKQTWHDKIVSSIVVKA